MRIQRLHETYVTDAESNLDARFASVSGSSIAEPYRLQRGVTTLAYDLDFESPQRVTLSQMPAALTLALSQQSGAASHGAWAEWLAAAAAHEGDIFYRFAEYLSYADIVPFASSPLELHSLASIAATASPLGIGAAVGFAVFGSSPLLLVGVPAGIIICGAAAGVSRALEEGLRERLLGLLTRRTSEDIEVTEALIEARMSGEATSAAPPQGGARRKEAQFDQESDTSDIAGAERSQGEQRGQQSAGS